MKKYLFLILLLLVICTSCDRCSKQGDIAVNSTPSGANVFLDNRDTGFRTNCVIGDVEAGTHTLRLVLEGYEDWERTVVVNSNELTQVFATLSQLYGEIAVNSNPEGAEVFLDNSSTGQHTNCILYDVSTGTHTIRLVLSGYADWQKTVTVSANKQTQVLATLIKEVGEIAIESIPEGATVYLDDNLTGEYTNCILKDVSVGKHLLRLVLSGYDDWTNTITVYSDEQTQVLAVFSKTAGQIAVNSTPDGAKVYLDNKYSGRRSNCILYNVNPGDHLIRLVLYGFHDWETTVTVVKDRKSIVNASLVDDMDATVYITNTGSKYHRSNCQYLSHSKIAIKKGEAIKQGYTPCSVCKP